MAAANVASFALLEDGRLFSWGSSWDFGTLGNGTDSGQASSPVPVVSGTGPLNNVVQIAARDNDAIAVTSDGSVYTWGSFPNTQVATGAISNTLGGYVVATKMTGLPANVLPRKALTEQGLYAVLYNDGAVYTWGVHFDITAQGVLYDLQPQRVLNMPPLRDLLPGGFIGYGDRPFDRNTALGVDYDGKYWKIRGRVAERFDPALPTRQRRPAHVKPFSDLDRANPLLCASCHTVMGKTLPASPPKTGQACTPIPSAIQELLTSESVCESCHNGAPLLGRDNRILPLLNCVVPTTLPAPPAPSTATGFTTQCQLPASNHVSIASGAFCASCHNGVIQQPLKCVVTAATTAPTLATTTAITAVFDSTGTALASGAQTSTSTPRVVGVTSAAPGAGESVEVLRNGVRVGTATTTGTSWSFTDATPTSNTYTYTARVISAGGLGRASAAYVIRVDNGVPGQTATITTMLDDAGAQTGNVPTGGSSDDATPTLGGSLSAALNAGQVVQVLRNGSVIGNATITGSTSWSYTDGLASAGAYTYTVRVASAAGVPGLASAAYVLNFVAGAPPAVAIASALDNAGSLTSQLASGSATDDATPLLQGSLASPIAGADFVRILRNGTEVGRAVVSGTSWTFQESAIADASYTYTAQAVFGATGTQGPLSSGFALSIEAAAPAQSAAVLAVGGTGNGGTINTVNPGVSGTVSATLPAGVTVELYRAGTLRGLATVSGTNWSFSDTGLSNGQSYTYTARTVSRTGVPGGLSSSLTVTVNTNGFAPISSVAGVSSSGGFTNGVSPSVIGTAPANATVRVCRTPSGACSNVVATAGGTWTYNEPTALSNGVAYTYTSEVSSGGVFGPASSFVINIDTTAPTASGLTLTIEPFTNTYPYSGTPWVSAASSNKTAIGDTLPLLRLSAYSGSDTLASVRILRPNGTVLCTVAPGATCNETVIQAPATGVVYTAELVDRAGNRSAGIASGNQLNLPLCQNFWPTSGAYASSHSPTAGCTSCHQFPSASATVLSAPARLSDGTWYESSTSSRISFSQQYQCRRP